MKSGRSVIDGMIDQNFAKKIANRLTARFHCRNQFGVKSPRCIPVACTASEFWRFVCLRRVLQKDLNLGLPRT